MMDDFIPPVEHARNGVCVPLSVPPPLTGCCSPLTVWVRGVGPTLPPPLPAPPRVGSGRESLLTVAPPCRQFRQLLGADGV